MNFQQVKQVNDNVTIFATFNEIGGVSLNQNGKQVCKCQLTDDNGEKHLVRLYGTMPHLSLLDTRQQFSLSSYQGTNQRGQPYTGFSGFWNDRAMVNQVPQPAQQSTPQMSQNRPQQPNITKQGMKMPDTYAYPVTPETGRRMARCALCCAVLQNGQKPLYSYIKELTEFVMTGQEPTGVAGAVSNDVTQPCAQCGQYFPDCECQPL